MQQEELDRYVQCAFTNITSQLEQLNEPPSIRSLCRLVEYTRGKRLIHDRRRLRPGLTAFAVGLRGRDLIRTCVDADGPVEETGVAHECVHLLAWDIPLISLDMEYPEFLVLPDELLAELYEQHVMVFRRVDNIEPARSAFIVPRISIEQRAIVFSSLEETETAQSAFMEPSEYIAEKVAALLVDYFEQYQLSVPDSAVIFGYTVP